MNDNSALWEGWEPAEPDGMPNLPPPRYQRLADGEPVLVILRAYAEIDDETLWRFAAPLVVRFELAEAASASTESVTDSAQLMESVTDTPQEATQAVYPDGDHNGLAIVVELRPTLDYPENQTLAFLIDPEIAVGGYPHWYAFQATRAVLQLGVVAVNNANNAQKAVNANLHWTQNNSSMTLFGNLSFQHPSGNTPALAQAVWFSFKVAPGASWTQYQIAGSITIT